MLSGGYQKPCKQLIKFLKLWSILQDFADHQVIRGPRYENQWTTTKDAQHVF